MGSPLPVKLDVDMNSDLKHGVDMQLDFQALTPKAILEALPHKEDLYKECQDANSARGSRTRSDNIHVANIVRFICSAPRIAAEVLTKTDELLNRRTDIIRVDCCVRWTIAEPLEFRYDNTGAGADTSIESCSNEEDELGDALNECWSRDANFDRLCTSELRTVGQSWAARIRRVSMAGALLESLAHVPNGSQVLLVVDETEAVPGRVNWVSGGYVGVQFDEPIEAQRIQHWVAGAHAKVPLLASSAGARSSLISA